MSIDFSKAPEGATHYAQWADAPVWYRVVGADVRMWFDDMWFPSKQYKDATAFTALPEPFVSVENAPATGSTLTEEQLEWARGVLSKFEHLTGAEKACAIAQHIIGLQIGAPTHGSAHDPVNSPSHYASGGVECIEAIKASMSHEAFLGYLNGNVQKYLWRYEKKANPVEDLKKAQWYLARLTKEQESE